MSQAPSPALLQFLRNLAACRAMVIALGLRDLQSRYAGTLGGLVWSLVHPAATILVFYFVFAVGFRAQGPSGAPFLVWFVCGLAPWMFFSETLPAIAGSVTGNAHLVKKTIFPTEVLPVVHLVSGVIPHLVFLIIVGGLLTFHGVALRLDRLLVLYYLGCLAALLLGLGWLLSALQAFFRDISQALTLVLNLWFWLTPIVWTPAMVPAQYRPLLHLNPMLYIVDGYRGLLVFDQVRWPGVAETAIFWGIAIALLVLGAFVFRRLKPEFADVV